MIFLYSTFFFLEHGGLNSEPRTCLEDTLPFEPLHQPFFVLGILEIGSLMLFAQTGLET
jgi:hypothetical protein